MELLDANWAAGKPLSDGVIAEFGSEKLKQQTPFPGYGNLPPKMRGTMTYGDGQSKGNSVDIVHAFVTTLPKSSKEVLANVAYLKLMLKLQCHSYDQKRVAAAPICRARAESLRTDQHSCEDEDLWALDVLLFDYLGCDAEAEFKKCLDVDEVHPRIDNVPKLLHAASLYCILTCFHDEKEIAVELLSRPGCNYGVRLALKLLVAIEMGKDFDASIVRQMQLKQQARILVGRRRTALALCGLAATEEDDSPEDEDDSPEDEDDVEEDEELTKSCGEDLIAQAEEELNESYGKFDALKAGDVVSGGKFTAYNGRKKYSFAFGPEVQID